MVRPLKPLTRRQLYDLVWSHPATDLARKLRISSVAVGKACRRWNIPAPPRGYWAKLRHEKTVSSPPPLPEGVEPVGGIPLGARARARDKPTKGIRLPRIKLCLPPEDPHPVVTLTAEAYRNRTIGRTGLLSSVPDASHVVMAVTLPFLERALDILNRLTWQLERNGFVFDCAPRLRDATIKLRYGGPQGATVRLLIMELIERKRNGSLDGTTWVYDQWVCRSTGRLRVVVDEYFPQNVRKSWSDGQAQRLEDILAKITEGFVLHGKIREKQRLAYLEQEQVRQAEERARLAEAERWATAERRLRTAHEMSANWHRANELRAFRDACRTRFSASGDAGPASQEQAWTEWLDRMIANIDPLLSGAMRQAVEELAAANASTAPEPERS